jgi:hypothetical protein
MNLLDKISTRKAHTKGEMIKYLNDHFRYHTLHSWNQTTSYIQNIKICNLPRKKREDQSKAYTLVSTAQAVQIVRNCLDTFHQQTDYYYSIISYGRSSGYLVMILSEGRDSGYKSRCPECNQLNYRLTPPNKDTLDNRIIQHLLKDWTNETISHEPEILNFPATEDEKQHALTHLRPIYKDFSADSSCGKCWFEQRENLTAPVYQTSIHFNGIDEGEDFADWSKDDLRERTGTVRARLFHSSSLLIDAELFDCRACLCWVE